MVLDSVVKDVNFANQNFVRKFPVVARAVVQCSGIAFDLWVCAGSWWFVSVQEHRLIAVRRLRLKTSDPTGSQWALEKGYACCGPEKT